MDDLTQQHCVPCEGGAVPFSPTDAKDMMPQVPGWTLETDGKSVIREFQFTDFKGSMVFVNTVAALAESEGHHPDITIRWNKVTLQLSTHAIGGLSTNDFVLAAKINKIT